MMSAFEHVNASTKQQIALIYVHWWCCHNTLICHDWERKLTATCTCNSSTYFSSPKCCTIYGHVS